MIKNNPEKERSRYKTKTIGASLLHMLFCFTYGVVYAQLARVGRIGYDGRRYAVCTLVCLNFYFIVSGESSEYLVKIKVVSITSEMISYHFTVVTDTIYISLFALGDFGFLHSFRCGSYLHFRFLNTSNFFVS